MAASIWLVHNDAIRAWNNKEIGPADTYVCKLFTGSSNVYDPTIILASAATNEVANGNGYSTGGTAVTLSIAEAAGLVTIDCTNALWPATGAGIQAWYAALINTTLGSPQIVASCELDVGGSVTASAGTTLSIQINVAGAWTIQRAP